MAGVRAGTDRGGCARIRCQTRPLRTSASVRPGALGAGAVWLQSGFDSRFGRVRIPAKADYAVRALVELAASTSGEPLPADRIAVAQGIAGPFLAGILGQLRLAGLVRSVRGAEGGFLLARPAEEITVADVVRAVDGPLATLSGQFPEELDYPGPAASMREVWVALRANIRAVLENVTIDQVAAGRLPKVVRDIVSSDDAWLRR